MLVNTSKVFVDKVVIMTAEANEFTVDQLAQDAKLPVSTIRMYQHRGLIEPPEKRGRVGYYGEGHRERLRLIAQLQDRGFSLAAIKEAVDSWTSGASLNDLLGVRDIAPGLATEPVRTSPAELAKKFGDIEVTQADIQRANEVGLIALDGSDVLVRTPEFLEIGPEVAGHGVPISVMLDEYDAMRKATKKTAKRFQAVFDEHLWAAFEANGMKADDIPALTEAATKLAQLASASITAELHTHFAEFVQDYISRASES